MDAPQRSVTRRGLGLASGVLGVAAILVGAASQFHPDLEGSDLWWHLASGRHIWQHHEIPLTDPFSHTAYGQPWMNHAWLWGWLFWAAYRAHPDLAAWVNLALLVGLFSLVAWTARRISRSTLAAGAATWLAAATCHWFLDVRPHIVTLLFTALLLATAERRRAPWLWPPLVALWANLHAGFVFGLGLLGLHALLKSVGALRQRRPLPRAEWVGLLCAALAAGLNPWGFAIYGVVLQPINPETPFRDLVEWRALVPSLDPTSYAGRFGWMAALALLGAHRARRAPLTLAAAAVTAVMAISARRFVPLFAISAAPLAALAVAAALDALRRRLPALSNPWLGLATSAAALLVAFSLWSDVRFLPRPLQRWTGGESFPSGAASYLASMPDPPRHLLNAYHWGGYLALQVPDVPVFIDGRAGTVYGDRLAGDYRTMIRAAPGWRQRFEKYGIDAVLVQSQTPLAAALRSQRPAWRVAYIDPRSVLLFPPADAGRAELLVPSELLPDGADLALSRGYRRRKRGDLDAAASALVAAQRMDPMQLYVYGELMHVAALRGDAVEVRRWIEEALRVYPRRWNHIWAFAEQAWGVMGRCQEKLDALRRLRHGAPFIPDEIRDEIRARIRELEAPSGARSDLGCVDAPYAPPG
ncbi:MAG TPA: hypothetical protein VIY27_04115 [Myxococcota bacterium]